MSQLSYWIGMDSFDASSCLATADDGCWASAALTMMSSAAAVGHPGPRS